LGHTERPDKVIVRSIAQPAVALFMCTNQRMAGRARSLDRACAKAGMWVAATQRQSTVCYS
jgi:hypothetical protein